MACVQPPAEYNAESDTRNAAGTNISHTCLVSYTALEVAGLDQAGTCSQADPPGALIRILTSQQALCHLPCAPTHEIACEFTLQWPWPLTWSMVSSAKSCWLGWVVILWPGCWSLGKEMAPQSDFFHGLYYLSGSSTALCHPSAWKTWKEQRMQWGWEGVTYCKGNLTQESSCHNSTHKKEMLLLESETISYNATFYSSYKSLYCY